MRRLVLFVLLPFSLLAAEGYQKPPKEIMDVLNAPEPPQIAVNPTRTHALLIQQQRYPSIADLSKPILRLAGLRIDPKANAPQTLTQTVSLTLKSLSGGPEIAVALPPGAKLSPPIWSPDGRSFAFTNVAAGTVELWIGDAANGKLRRVIEGLNTTFGNPPVWLPDSRTILVKLVPSGRGKAPEAPVTPPGPVTQESAGNTAPVRTFQDLLSDAHDEALFDYYATSQLALLDTAFGKTTPIGVPGLYFTASPSPDGKLILANRVHKPYSYVHPHFYFPRDIEVLDRSGKVVHTLASLPLSEVPIDGVPTGPRNVGWRPTEPATLFWVEALDGGDPRKKVPLRDRLLIAKAPFSGEPEELTKTEQRLIDLDWLEAGTRGLVTDYDRDKRWVRTFLIGAGAPPKLLFSHSINERYKDPGQPVQRRLPNGHIAVLEHRNAIYLAGPGATPEGDRPFFDRFSLDTQKSERIFQSDAKAYQTAVTPLSADASRLLIRSESPADPPNYFVRTTTGDLARISDYKDPAPQLRTIEKRLVKYKRPDGVDLSFTLYLPPGYKEGTRLPTVVWAYPLEFADAATAGQVTGSTQRFTFFQGPSQMFFLLSGYAILDNASMPVVGDPETVNNTYIEQIVASAKAAIDKAAELGVTDPNRVGVGGHSYGAFMTANLLAHSDLFKAGIARSGAYNRTLTPFGFQSERRTVWEAPDIYLRMSPFMSANKIKEPILLIHGEADNNPGTFPVQSERMYQAVRGNGGTVRLVMLPHESHGYAARESIEHTLYEMMAWFDRYVKHADTRTH